MDDLKRILVVDDSRTITASVCKVLDLPEYELATAHSGEDALQNVEKFGLPHLAIVDLNLGRNKMTGFQLCGKLHKFSTVPIIMLTSEDTEGIVVEGLQRYAEDYITKPFRAQELKVRVWRVLQRMGDFSYTLAPTIAVDERLQVNLPHREVIVAGETVSLTPTEAKLLYVLLKHAGRGVRTEFLLRHVWPLDEAYEDRLHSHIYRLRKKIEPDSRDPRYILSEWGTGYIFPAADTFQSPE